MFCFISSMQLRFVALWMMFVSVLAPSVYAGGLMGSDATVSFHIETEASDNPKMIFAQQTNGKTRYFRRMPEITTKDMVAFNPFPSDAGGDDYGIVFQLKDNATKRFAAITNINQGRWLIAQINGRIVDGVLIDRPVDDGFIVIWKGAMLADVHIFEKKLQRIGANGKKKPNK